MKTIGLIGGMSYSSTITYYEKLNKLTSDHFGDLTTPKILLSSVNFGEIEKLQHKNDWEQLGQIMNNEAQLLTSSGAEVLALCTNTMHKLEEAMLKDIDTNFIHIANPTAQMIKDSGYSKPALIATKFTMEEEFYISKLKEYSLDPIVPSSEDREVLHSIIYDELCFNILKDESRKLFIQIVENVKLLGADSVILGCTEVGLLLNSENSSLPVFDTVDLHCEAIIQNILN